MIATASLETTLRSPNTPEPTRPVQGGAYASEDQNIASSQYVALMEDDNQLAGLLVDFLEDEGYTVVRCQSIEQVRDVLQEHPGSVAVCDDWSNDHLELSEEHRAEIARLAEGNRLVLTTGRVWADGASAESLGGAVVVGKPFDLEDVLGALSVRPQ